MSSDVSDLRSTIIPKSDQLNTDQLLGGPLVITVKDVRVGSSDEQPVSIFYDMDPARPYKPCKTMRKVLIHAWGPNGREWIGKSMELYAEPSVKFGGELVGGIRISRLTDIPKEIRVSLTATKGKKSLHEIGRLELSAELTSVLAAIAAATGRESLQKARKQAEALTSQTDLAMARAAYAKKVEALKEKAATSQTVDRSTSQIEPTDRPDSGAEPKDGSAPNSDPQEHPQARAGDTGRPAVSYVQVAEALNKAATIDKLDEAALLIDAVASVKQQKELVEVYKRRQQELEG